MRKSESRHIIMRSIFTINQRKPSRTPRKLLDVSKSAALGWHYRTELEEGIRLTYEDFLSNPMRAER